MGNVPKPRNEKYDCHWPVGGLCESFKVLNFCLNKTLGSAKWSFSSTLAAPRGPLLLSLAFSGILLVSWVLFLKLVLICSLLGKRRGTAGVPEAGALCSPPEALHPQSATWLFSYFCLFLLGILEIIDALQPNSISGAGCALYCHHSLARRGNKTEGGGE